MLRLHRTAPVPSVLERREDTPPALAEAIHRAMAKDPADRWPSAQMMRSALPRVGTLPASARQLVSLKTFWYSCRSVSLKQTNRTSSRFG